MSIISPVQVSAASFYVSFTWTKLGNVVENSSLYFNPKIFDPKIFRTHDNMKMRLKEHGKNKIIKNHSPGSTPEEARHK